MEENRKYKSITKKNITIIILIVAIVAIASIVFYNVYNFYKKQSMFNEFKSMITTINNNFQNCISPYFDEYDLVKSIDASSNSVIEYNNSEDWYEWNEDFEVSIYVDNSFDAYSEKEQCEYIKGVGSRAIHAFQYGVWDQYPKYGRYKNMDPLQLYDLFGKFITQKADYTIMILTDNNTYEYSSLDDYFYKNNEEIYVGTYDGDIDSILSNSNDYNSLEEFNDSSSSENITDDEKNICWHLATETVKSNLKSPSDANFPPSYNSGEVSITKSGNIYTVNSWVESENSYGANLRKRFFVTITKEGSGDSATYTADNCIIE